MSEENVSAVSQVFLAHALICSGRRVSTAFFSLIGLQPAAFWEKNPIASCASWKNIVCRNFILYVILIRHIPQIPTCSIIQTGQLCVSFDDFLQVDFHYLNHLEFWPLIDRIQKFSQSSHTSSTCACVCCIRLLCGLPAGAAPPSSPWPSAAGGSDLKIKKIF